MGRSKGGEARIGSRRPRIRWRSVARGGEGVRSVARGRGGARSVVRRREGARESSERLRTSGVVANVREEERRSAEGREGVPLTITPPLEEHRLDAEVAIVIGRKGISPKAIARMRRGADGFLE